MSQIESKSKVETVDTKVGYLPASKPFRHDYDKATSLATVHTDAMTFFGVQDYTDRDAHEFHLEHNGQRVDYSQTVGALAEPDGGNGKKKHQHLHLDLVEQVTAGEH